jgi:hypothetical protein
MTLRMITEKFIDDNERLNQLLESSIQECSQANLELVKVKQSNDKLVMDNKRSKDEMEQDAL